MTSIYSTPLRNVLPIYIKKHYSRCGKLVVPGLKKNVLGSIIFKKDLAANIDESDFS